MKKNQYVIPIIMTISAIVIVSIVILITINNNNFEDQTPRPDFIDKNTSSDISSGPLTILNSKFKIGESVFFTVRGLQDNDVGKILFFTPKGKLYQSYPFNGTEKSDFNGYFKPDTSKVRGVCTPEDIIGNWTVMLDGTNYKNLQYEFQPEFLIGAEADVKPVC